MEKLNEVKNRLINVINLHEYFKNHVYIVGGYVRDFVMNIEPKDLDLVVDLNKGNVNFAKAEYRPHPAGGRPGGAAAGPA